MRRLLVDCPESGYIQKPERDYEAELHTIATAWCSSLKAYNSFYRITLLPDEHHRIPLHMSNIC